MKDVDCTLGVIMTNDSKIREKLLKKYGTNCEISIEYDDACYIANIIDKNTKNAIRGHLYNLEQQEIDTPVLERISKKGGKLYGLANNKEYLLIRREVGQQIYFEIIK